MTFSTLFPNAAQPAWGIFVETRLRHLVASGRIASRVVAPVPWFPSRNPRFGRYAGFASAPRSERRFGATVDHPRFLTLPKVGMTIAPALLALGAAGELRRLRAGGFDFDLIDAHYYYPDGVAAALLGQWFNRPVVITARGTDVNLLPRYGRIRRMIRWASERAAASIAVCQALKDEMIAIGMDGERIQVLRNGVDLSAFAPLDQREARRRLGFGEGPLALSVGYLIERKGHHFAIEALRELLDWRLVIVGSGEMESELRSLADRCGVTSRVHFAGEVSQHALRDYYCAADLLVLASSREGMANVLLESLACGTPVVATALWGTPEVIAAPEAGVLMKARSTPALVEAVRRLAANRPSRERTRAYAGQFGWDRTTAGQLELFSRILSDRGGVAARPQAGRA